MSPTTDRADDSTTACPYAVPGARDDSAVPPRSIRKIAVAGKGGTGKTTISGILAREIARRGERVWAVDADSNPNLATTLGLDPRALDEMKTIPRSILAEDRDAEGRRVLKLGVPVAEVVDSYAALAPDQVKLLLMGRVDHAGAG